MVRRLTARDGGRMRGGSTITQQLVKNLFFGTGRSILRKGEVRRSGSLLKFGTTEESDQ
jgi:membrane peptidoglycan carboxypeptidase